MENDRQFKNILSSRCLWELRKTRREEAIVKSRNKSIRTTKNESQQIQSFPLFSLCMHLSQLIGGMIQIKIFSILALSIYWPDNFFLWGMLSYLYCGTFSNVPGLNQRGAGRVFPSVPPLWGGDYLFFLWRTKFHMVENHCHRGKVSEHFQGIWQAFQDITWEKNEQI